MESPQAQCALPPLQGPFANEERGFLSTRRKNLSIRSDAPVLGLALSGGGIRSATFSLGVLQALAALGLLTRVDLLSTVSGGGYLGGFLGGLFCGRKEGEVTSSAQDVEEGLKPGSNPNHKVRRCLGWLRENGRYLTPGGSGDGFLAAAVAIRNWIAVLFVVVLFGVLAWMTVDLIAMAAEHLKWFVNEPIRRPLRFEALRVFWVSPWVHAPLVVLGISLIYGWSYFLVGHPGSSSKSGLAFLQRRPWIVAVLVSAFGFAALLLISRPGAPFPRWLWNVILYASIAALCAALNVGLFWNSSPSEMRRALTRMLRLGLVTSVVLVILAFVDSLGWTLAIQVLSPSAKDSFGEILGHAWDALADLLTGDKWKNGLGAALAALAAPLLKTWISQKKSDHGGRFRSFLDQFALWLLTAIVLLFSLVGAAILAAVAHLIWYPIGSQSVYTAIRPYAAYVFLFLIVLNWLVGQVLGFLNQSTLGPFYTAALTRAYLGASNPERWEEGNALPDRRLEDDLPWDRYRPWEKGGPLHFINVTVNETTGGRSQVVQKDRKGTNLAVGPAGISIGVRWHAKWDTQGTLLSPIEESRTTTSRQPTTASARFLGYVPPRVFPGAAFPPEQLTVGQWIGISGAAFTTGMGSYTRLLTSLLTGFFNVRLGYWWRWGGKPSSADATNALRRSWELLFPVQSRLFEEWLAIFPGTSSKLWYLSDGGHFENTGAFELLRRQVPYLLVCDNGKDSSSRFEDVANLVAKARTDLDTEIEFLSATELDDLCDGHSTRTAYGSLDQMLDPAHSAVAAMARIRYLGPDTSEGLLILLKPTMAPGLPMDVRDYGHGHPPFPQQTTLDQFFDERQWESYRKLGESITLLALGDRQLHPARWLRARLA